jgi:integrase
LKKLNEYFEHRKLSQITVKDIDDFKLIRLRDVKPSSLNRELATLSHLFNYAKRQKRYFGENPVSISKLLPEHNQVERTLTLEEEERLLNNCPTHLRVIVVCALNTGMRIGEIISLKWKNVDLDNNVITLEHTNTKNKKSRRIPTNSYLRNLLIEQKLKVGNADHVFLNSKGVSYKRYDSLNQVFRRAKKMGGIENLRFHDLRHSAATRMAESGVSIIAINKILGHADLKTTMRYAHPDDSLKDAVEILGNFNNKCSNFCSNEKSG